MQIHQKLIEMKKALFILAVFSCYISIHSQEQNTIPVKNTQLGFANIDYLSIKMPNDKFGNPEINMGITGIHYNLWLNKSIYTGLGFYGSVDGKRGGLFTLGINAGIKTLLTEK